MIYPKPLKKGDTVGLIAPSGSIPEERIEPAVKAIEKFGLKIVLGRSVKEHHGYFAGCDYVRAYDINEMFADKTIDGIIAMRGGYGAGRILPLIDYDIIKNNPKIFAGYSDITALHTVINQRCDLLTYHSPMPAIEFFKGIDEYSLQYFVKNLFTHEPVGEIENPKGQEIKVLIDGEAEGILTGGNLSVMVSQIGTEYEIDTKNKILFIEEVGESTYKVDRMLNQLRQSGKFRDAAGIILGEFVDCEPKNTDISLTLKEAFTEILGKLRKPVIYNVACGHSMPTLTLPLGAEAVIKNNRIIIG